MKEGVRVFLVLVAVFALLSCEPKEKAPSVQQTTKVEKPKDAGELNIANIGDTVQAGAFAVVVNKAYLDKKIDVGNEFLNLEEEPGVQYIIIEVTFKNTGTKEKMLFDGTLYINDETQVFTFDTSETILADGWGLFLETINPMISKQTKLAYKISTEIKGTASWVPQGSDTYILIGSIE